MTVIGCEDFIIDEDVFESNTLNLTSAGENAIFLTLKGAKWKNPDTYIKNLLLGSLKWDQKSGKISNLETETTTTCEKTKANEIKITFSKTLVLGGTDSYGSGTVKLIEKDTDELCDFLMPITEDMEEGIWAIGKNDPVNIKINIE